MALGTLSSPFPYANLPDYPVPEQYSAANMALTERHLYSLAFGVAVDDFTAITDLLVYLPGSGTTSLIYGHIADRWIAGDPLRRGYLTTQWSGSLLSDPTGQAPPQRLVRPTRYGYGNVNSPLFSAGFCMGAHYTHGLVGANSPVLQNFPGVQNIYLLGQSAGATNILAYFANYHGADLGINPMIRGAIINAPTQAGLGTGSWNNPARLTNSFSQMFSKKMPRRTLVTYADNDLYAPPDMARRYQAGSPNDSDTYFVSPGPLGHSWPGVAANADLLFMWIDQLVNNQPFTLRDGVTPALPGATGILGA